MILEVIEEGQVLDSIMIGDFVNAPKLTIKTPDPRTLDIDRDRTEWIPGDFTIRVYVKAT